MSKNTSVSSKNLQTLFYFLRLGYKARLKWWKKDQFVYFDRSTSTFKLNSGQIFSFSIDEEKNLIVGILEKKLTDSKDWTGNKASVYKTLAASSHSSSEREENDFYATDPRAIDFLLECEKLELKLNIAVKALKDTLVLAKKGKSFSDLLKSPENFVLNNIGRVLANIENDCALALQEVNKLDEKSV